MKRDYRLYLQDILDVCGRINRFVGGMTIDDFIIDEKTSSAVIRQFEIMGEATKRIPEDIKGKYPQIPWKEMAGMRDRLIHDYLGVDYFLVWDTIQNKISGLISQISQVICDLNDADHFLYNGDRVK